MIVVGLTGNYGMGKSTVAKMFKELGAVTLDTDMLAKEFLREPAVIGEIRKAFGDDIVQGSDINTIMLADIVFEHPHLRISLENILHPRIFRKVDEELSKIASHGEGAVVIVEAPVIFERGYQNKFDRLVTVFTSEETALQRLEAKGIPGGQARKRLKSQFPVEMKVQKSDFAIDNNESRENTIRQVEDIYRELCALEKGLPMTSSRGKGWYMRKYGNN